MHRVLGVSQFTAFVTPQIHPSYIRSQTTVESKSPQDLMFRLLQLEQRFEAYYTLYEEELAEIKDNLRQLREDILSFGSDLEVSLDEERLAAPSDGNTAESDKSSNPSQDLSV